MSVCTHTHTQVGQKTVSQRGRARRAWAGGRACLDDAGGGREREGAGWTPVPHGAWVNPWGSTRGTWVRRQAGLLRCQGPSRALGVKPGAGMEEPGGEEAPARRTTPSHQTMAHRPARGGGSCGIPLRGIPIIQFCPPWTGWVNKPRKKISQLEFRITWPRV